MADTAVHHELPLAAEFPATDRAEWLRLVEKALKDRPFEKLISRTYDGIAVEPLYARAMGAAPVAGRAPGLPWAVTQRVDHPDPAAANAQARQDLDNGADGLALVLAGAPAAHGYGVKADNAAALERTLDGVMLDMIALRIETAPFAGRPIADLVTALVDKRKLDPAALAIDFGLDPVGDMARTGRALLPWPELSKRAGGTAAMLRDKGFAAARFLRADGRAVHEAGGSEAQELAFVVAAGVAYLRLLETAGFPLDEARRRITFLLAADADEFLTIAKFRALRKLWARVEEASGLAPQPASVAAETAWRMMSARDPYVNMLRATIAVTAAGIGGADSITVLPFTAALGLPDRFARRVARNLQLILLEESNLYRVADPAAGSGGIEALTAELAKTRLGAGPGDRARRRRRGRARTRPHPDEGRRHPRRAAGGDRQTSGRADRRQRLSQSRRGEGRRARRGPRRCAGAAADGSSSRCRRCGWPNRSSACATRPTPSSPRPARGRRCSSPISAGRPTSPRAPPSPRTSTRPAASRRSAMMASQTRPRWSPRSRHPARALPACARRTRSMRPRRPPPPRR